MKNININLTANEIKDNRELFWTLVDLCNNHGEDKELLTTRVELAVEGLKDVDAYIASAEKPGLSIRAVEAVQDILDGETPNHFVHLDAVNSSMQFYSVLSGCLDLGKACAMAPAYDDEGNLVRPDAYKMLADSLNDTFGLELYSRKECKPVLDR